MIGRRSEKIKKELERCIEKVISAIKKLLEDAGDKDILKFNPEESNEIGISPFFSDDRMFQIEDYLNFRTFIKPMLDI